MAESFSRKKIKASTAERRWMENPVLPSSCVTPAGTSIEVQNEWEENTHTHTNMFFSPLEQFQILALLSLGIALFDFSITNDDNNFSWFRLFLSEEKSKLFLWFDLLFKNSRSLSQKPLLFYSCF